MAYPVLSAYQAKVSQIIQDADEELALADRDAFIQEAFGIHSKHRPQVKVAEVNGTGAYLYDLPTDWEEGFSEIESVEYPVSAFDLNAQVPNILDQTRYMIYQGTSKKQLRFLYDTPGATETFLLTYTLRHAVDESAGTIPDADFDAVCNLAGALCCYALGRKLTEESGGASMAVRDQTWRSVLRYSEKGKELMALYNAHMGLNDDNLAASVSGTWQSSPTWKAGWTFFRRRTSNY
jgi:hypothetical protein